MGSKYFYTHSRLTKMRWNSSHRFVINVYDPSNLDEFYHFTGFHHSRRDYNTVSESSVNYSTSEGIWRTSFTKDKAITNKKLWTRFNIFDPKNSLHDISRKDLHNGNSMQKMSKEMTINLALIWIRLRPVVHQIRLMYVRTNSNNGSGPVFCLLLGLSSDYAQPITGQVTSVTCPVIGRAQPDPTPSKRQKMGPGNKIPTRCQHFTSMKMTVSMAVRHIWWNHRVLDLRIFDYVMADSLSAGISKIQMYKLHTHFLSQEATCTIMHAFITIQIDYCNSLMNHQIISSRNSSVCLIQLPN